MNVAEYLVNILIENNVTDVFGIPGGVVLDLIYAFDKSSSIKAHLSYHEQAAAFEASGYAQVEYTLGVAYATRGPGFTNMLTGIADAYADSIPVLFITAHSGEVVGHEQRFEKEQEMDTVQMVQHITKYAAAIDTVADAMNVIQKAIYQATDGRKGPVLLDFSVNLWNKEIDSNNTSRNECGHKENAELLDAVAVHLKHSKRPVFLLGDGIRQSGLVDSFAKQIDRLGIPVLTSRSSQDVGSACSNYYGYIGSHGIRYGNFIFSKADLVISLGNRLAFPINSESYSKAIENKKIIRVEIDEGELKREIPNSLIINTDLKTAVNSLEALELTSSNYKEWLNVCYQLKKALNDSDVNSIVCSIAEMMVELPNNFTLVADVGNNEFWTSRGYELCGVKNRILYSKSFGALGCGIGKAIGAYYKTKKPVVCIVGDQGFQLNIQELQLVAQERLPIAIYVVNNNSSGMIRDREAQKFGSHFIHTTNSTGFGSPNTQLIANAYGLNYCVVSGGTHSIKNVIGDWDSQPIIIEEVFDEEIKLIPSLPKGNVMQDLVPKIEIDKYL